MICTFYAHRTGFATIVKMVESVFPQGKTKISQQGGSDVIEVELKGGLFKSSSWLRIQYRQKTRPSYQIEPNDNSPLTNNLRGLYGYVSNFPISNQDLRNLFLQKILTINCEFSLAIQGEVKELKQLIRQFADRFDAILFVQPGTVISQSKAQHFLDKNLALIADQEGNSAIDTLAVNIEAAYFDNDPSTLTPDQLERKSRSEEILKANHVKLNTNLPCLKAEADTHIREAKEIAQRVVVLALTNLVAFNEITADIAKQYLTDFQLWDLVTLKEKDFLEDPTEEKKSYETWKCEGIWTLLWAINKVEHLPFPSTLCSLGDIPAGNYPVRSDKDPNDFIKSVTAARSKAEIMDAADLYYRMDWACVDARLKGQQITELHPGVVFERHYALNWLVRYLDQQWDDVSCDT
ncbi:MAG: DUF4272 domain-containing protein [Chitinophagaceae bacterium]|nr:DUF4272 domain-containing protein [Chitinophagaceae bacterium]